jgi:hypothetical protein
MDRERRMLEAIHDGEKAGVDLELTWLAGRVRLDPDDPERNPRLVVRSSPPLKASLKGGHRRRPPLAADPRFWVPIPAL